MRLQQWYRSNAGASVSDIAYHFPYMMGVLRETRAHTVIELGVREGHSSSALLMGLLQNGAGSLWSVDIEPMLVPPLSGAAFQRVRWEQLVADDLSPLAQGWLPAECDVVFIDTSHAYDQTLAELELYVPRVRAGGRVLLHDTANEHPEDHGEPIGPQEPFPVRRAVADFCSAHGLDWIDDPASWGLATVFC